MNHSDIVFSSERSEKLQAKAAAGLKKLGVLPGDRVVLCTESSPELLFAIGGSLRSGITPVVVNPQLVKSELDPIIEDSDSVAVIDSTVKLQDLFGTAVEELSKFPLTRPMLYTSGTSGIPKGVFSPVIEESEAEKLWLEEIEQWSFSKEDVHLVCSPLYHSAPIRFALSTLLVGGSIVVPGKFESNRIVGAIKFAYPTTAFCTPAHLQRLVESGDISELSSLRLVLHAGAKCDEKLKRIVINEVGADKVWEFYGSTEGQFSVCSSTEWLEKPGTVGKAKKNRKIEVGSDQVIWSACPRYARWEYWNDSVKTSKAWMGEYFTVGDLGHLDADGYLYLLGRRDDLVISGAINLYPVEIEAVLQKIEGIKDVVVFGVNDEKWGQKLCAAIVGKVTTQQIDSFVKENLAPFKRPKEYFFVQSIPRTALDKVRRSRMAIDLGIEEDLKVEGVNGF